MNYKEIQKKEMLQIIINFKKENGFLPSTRELCKLSGLSSTSTVNALLKQLQQDGLISMRPRSLEV